MINFFAYCIWNMLEITLQELKLHVTKICNGVVFSGYPLVKVFVIDISIFYLSLMQLCSSVGKSTVCCLRWPGLNPCGYQYWHISESLSSCYQSVDSWWIKLLMSVSRFLTGANFADINSNGYFLPVGYNAMLCWCCQWSSPWYCSPLTTHSFEAINIIDCIYVLWIYHIRQESEFWRKI